MRSVARRDQPESALVSCQLERPAAFAGAVEIVRAQDIARTFPLRISEGLGICLKWGPGHRVMANGRAEVYPSDALCVRAPGCVWSSEAARVAFLSIDVAPSLLPPEFELRSMRFFRPTPELDLSSFVQRIAAADKLVASSALVELINGLVARDYVRAREASTSASACRSVRRARELLVSALEHELTLDELATEVGSNKFVLIRQFRKQVGSTPAAYRNLMRVERARSLLGRGASVGEVAAQLGFSDQAHFCRHFKRVVGLTPSGYARSARSFSAAGGRARWPSPE